MERIHVNRYDRFSDKKQHKACSNVEEGLSQPGGLGCPSASPRGDGDRVRGRDMVPQRAMCGHTWGRKPGDATWHDSVVGTIARWARAPTGDLRDPPESLTLV